jgi:hypothetical protein
MVSRSRCSSELTRSNSANFSALSSSRPEQVIAVPPLMECPVQHELVILRDLGEVLVQEATGLPGPWDRGPLQPISDKLSPVGVGVVRPGWLREPRRRAATRYRHVL